MKCTNCPLATSAESCRGERNARFCERANPKSPDHSPSFLRKLANFTVAFVEHVAAGVPMATDEQKNTRLAICQACEHFVNGGCRKCGCSMDIKASWAEQACPLDPPKWGPVTATQTSSDTR